MSRQDQLWLEEQYSPKKNRKRVWESLSGSPEMWSTINEAYKALEAWLDEPCTYVAKQTRKDALRASYDHTGHVVEKVLTTIVMEGETSLTNIVMSLVGLTDVLEKRQAILLAAEVVSIIADSDAYDIYKLATIMMVRSRIQLDDDLITHLNQTCYLPPLVTKPKRVTSNWDTPYFSYEGESLILGSRINHHEGDVCLDVINIQNAIPLALSMDFISVYQEPEPDYAKDKGHLPVKVKNQRIAKAKKAWSMYQSQCSYFTHLLGGLGNKIYLGNRVDKRGRMYCSGYHISPQGNSYRKAVVELHETHSIEVPEQYRV